MTSIEYVLLAYAIGLALLWGYAVVSWLSSRSLRTQEAMESPHTGGTCGGSEKGK